MVPSAEAPSSARGICVLGMGRSGTSLLANLVADLGVTLGPRQELLEPAPSGENPRGYWEQREIVRLNDELLAHLGGGWYDVVDPPPGWELAEELDPLYSRARDLIEELFRDEVRWAFKDPRASLTLPFWRRVMEQIHCVICVRDPVAVARSLEARDAMAHPRWRSSAVWLAYTSFALEHSHDEPRAIFHYEDVMSDPRAELGRLADFLGVEAGVQELDEAAEGTVETGLWHHQADGGGEPDPFLLPEAIELHRLLKADPGAADLDARAQELRRSGLARIGPVMKGRLPPLRGARKQEAADTERFDPSSMSGTIEAEHVLRYRAAARLAAGKRVLDAGCGLGYGTGILAAAGATRAVGVDASEEAIEAASAHPGADFLVGDIASLPFEDDSFDLVACFEALEHLVRREEALDELARVLDPAGLLLISTPNRLRYHEGNPHHVYEYEPEEFRAALGRRFSHVRLLRQYTLTASILRLEGESTGGGLVVEGDWSDKLEPGEETYTLAMASQTAPAHLPALAAIVSPDDPDSFENLAAQARERAASLQERSARLHRRNRELQRLNRELHEIIKARDDESIGLRLRRLVRKRQA